MYIPQGRGENLDGDYNLARHRLETERLLLVVPHIDHLPAYTSYCASDRSAFVGGPFNAGKAFEKLCAMAGHWNMRGFGRFVMLLKKTGQPIGHVGALQLEPDEMPEMTWTIWDGACEGKGYAFEAAQAYLSQAKTMLGAEDMLIRIEKNNRRSIQLANRIGAELDDGAVVPAWMPDAVTFIVKIQ